ncbi:MAG: glycerol-3-phosphate acyltransferase [Nitrospirales bacterium]|nr:MAG: glycerol-3-phosphate acyltransferase [Nitrospirales bacterium]
MDLNWTQMILSLICAYGIGSIPFGVFASKVCKTQDPRTTGSGNIGFTNVLRVSGKKAGLITLIGDAGKGFLVAWLAQRYIHEELAVLLIAAAVIAGHIFSVFLKFHGGKGVATALAAVGGLHLGLGLSVTAVWLFAVWGFGYSSGGAIAAFLMLPIFAYAVFSQSLAFVFFTIGVSALVLFRHKDNISRLLAGTEGKLGMHSS